MTEMKATRCDQHGSTVDIIDLDKIKTPPPTHLKSLPWVLKMTQKDEQYVTLVIKMNC